MRLLLTVLMVLAFSNLAEAGARKLQRDIIKGEVIYTFCIDGYKFVLARGNLSGGESPSIVQFYEEKNGKALPAKCS